MTFVYRSRVEASPDEVFAWHTRPGAFDRLMPPWQPVHLAREASSVRDGTAVLALPGGMRVSARHQPDEYDPPHRFVDRIVTPGIGTLVGWRHVHDLEALGPDATEMVDRVDARVPRALLTPMFRYRHAQLAADLASHARARAWNGGRPATIAITGSSGLVGTGLAAFLTTGGHRVIRLVRREPRRPDERRWRPDDPDPATLAGVDAVVHLAGASIAGRFTRRHRELLRESRIGPTRRLAEAAVRAAEHSGDGPSCLVTASAIGYYGHDRGDEPLTEDSPGGDDFLAGLVRDWEAATAPAAEGGLRVVRVRTGIVQTPRGGTLRIFLPLFLAGLGGRLGDGRQWTSWIAVDDLLDIYLRACLDPAISGPVNAVAPAPVSNSGYTRTLAAVLHRPAFVPVPRFGPRLLLGGQGARELAEANQRVLPQRLHEAGHTFRYPTLEPALRHLLGRAPVPG